MGKYIVIGYPLVVLVLALAAGVYFLWHSFVPLSLASFLKPLGDSPLRVVTAKDAYLQIDQYRWHYNLPPFDRSQDFCDAVFANDDLTVETLAKTTCEDCAQAGILQISNNGTPDSLLAALTEDEQALTVLDSKDFTHLCARNFDDHLTLFFAEKQGKKVETVSAVPVQNSSDVSTQVRAPLNFSEADLWEALMLYRESHKVGRLELDENVCRYARKRVQDHIDNYGVKPKEEYLRVDKYPLDAHEGFTEDAESGYVFEVTGKNKVAENLAYWPGAQDPIHVIEWGWDTSTEGHREAQLSTEYGWGCLTGKDGFYVAIFAH